jgi:DNA-binding LacI/PurR family transcriptional regulator
MQQLDYHPNRAARTLVTAKTRTLGVLVSNPGLFGPNSMLNAMEAQARKAGYFVVSTVVDAQDQTSIEAGVEHLKVLGIDGLVVIAQQDSVLSVAGPRFGSVPVVAVYGSPAVETFSVAIDNYAGAKLATRHLIELGHRGVFHVSGPETWHEARARAAGYCDEMAAHGLEPLATVAGDWSAKSGHDIGLKLAERITKADDITAVFAANDQLALGLLNAFTSQGIRVPEQVSIVGFDDQPEAAYFSPPLTTVRQDFEQLGQSAMMLMVDELNGHTTVEHQLQQPTLVVRESSGPVGK